MTTSTTLLYGQTRTAKTSQTRFVAEKVWKKYGLKTRFITSDTGSMWDPIQDLVDVGIVKPLFVPTDPVYYPQATIRKIRRGEMPGGGVIKPWAVRNGTGNPLPQNKWIPWDQQEDSKEIGAYVFEMASFGDGMLRDLREKNITIGDKNVPGLRSEDGEVFASNMERHYGDAQTEISDFFNWVAHIPVHEVLLTLHETMKFIESKDANAGARSAIMGTPIILGPNIPGKMAITSVPSKVGMCLHMVWEATDKGQELRAYIKPHSCGYGKAMWPAGLRSISIPPVLNLIEKRYPQGFVKVSIEQGIGELFDLREETEAIAKEYAQKLIAK